MEHVKPSVRRCAVYTRKSSEEGLDPWGDQLASLRGNGAFWLLEAVGKGLCVSVAGSESDLQRLPH